MMIYFENVFETILSILFYIKSLFNHYKTIYINKYNVFVYDLFQTKTGKKISQNY